MLFLKAVLRIDNKCSHNRASKSFLLFAMLWSPNISIRLTYLLKLIPQHCTAEKVEKYSGFGI